MSAPKRNRREVLWITTGPDGRETHTRIGWATLRPGSGWVVSLDRIPVGEGSLRLREIAPGSATGPRPARDLPDPDRST